METKIEVPNGHKAVVDHFIIDESSFIIIKVEPKEEKKELRKIFKDGDFVVLDDEWVSIYKGEGDSDDTISDYCGCYLDGRLTIRPVTKRPFKSSIKHATDAHKQVLLNLLKMNGLEWNGKELVEALKKGDFVIAWNIPERAVISIYERHVSGSDYPHSTSNSSYINAVKWDGTKEHFERVLKGVV